MPELSIHPITRRAQEHLDANGYHGVRDDNDYGRDGLAGLIADFVVYELGQPVTAPNTELHLPPEPEVGTEVKIVDSIHTARFERLSDTAAIHGSTSLRIDRKDAGKFHWAEIKTDVHGEPELRGPSDFHTWAQVWSHVVDSVWDEYDPHLIVNPTAPHKRGDTLTFDQVRDLGLGAVVRALQPDGSPTGNALALTRVTGASPGWSPYPPIDGYTYELLAEGD